MKSILIFLSILCAIPARSQLKSELNIPRSGDELVKEQVAFCDAGESGENQTWNFKNIKLINDAYIVHYFTRDNWETIGAENGKLTFLEINGDSLLMSGYETSTDLVRYHSSGLLLRFPITYDSASQGRYDGRGKHHDRLESIISGEIHTKADAAGSLILPGNDTLTDIIRVHIRKMENARYVPISGEFSINRPANKSLFSNVDPEIITTDTYQWYEEGYRYPVFETIETYREDSINRTILNRSAYFYHPADQAYLPEDTANQVVLERKLSARKAKIIEKESNILSFACYPNPARDHVEIELTLRKAVAIKADLWGIHGRLVKHFPSKSPSTHYRERMDMQTLPHGYYVVKVSAGGEAVSEEILKH